MKNPSIVLSVFASALVLGGCKKKEAAAPEAAPEAEAAAAPAGPAPGTGESAPSKGLKPDEAVRAAMEKRQYADAVRIVLQLQGSAQSEQQLQQAAILKQEVKLGLMDIAGSDRKAYEALGMLRATTLNR